jgi:hypothetical protein
MDISKVSIVNKPPEDVNVIVAVSLRAQPINYEF